MRPIVSNCREWSSKIIILLIAIGNITLYTCDKDKVTNNIYNGPPQVIFYDTINASPGWTIGDTIDYADSIADIQYPLYKIISFDGPTDFGNGLKLDTSTGEWSWDIGSDKDYSGSYNLLISIYDWADLCDTRGSSSAGTFYTAYYNIIVSGTGVSINLIHDQLQGHQAEISISLNSSFNPNSQSNCYLDYFRFMIGYDGSALTDLSVKPSDLIDKHVFEYFIYDVGHFAGCGNNCPPMMALIEGVRDIENGATNPHHVNGPGELVKITFLVSNDYNFAGDFVPIQFFWLGCGDNVICCESDDYVYGAKDVCDHNGAILSDPSEIYGYSGPVDSCYDTTLESNQLPYPTKIPALNFRNGGIAIIPIPSIDDGCDINLNGIINDIADAVIFANYFIYGPSVFTIDYDRQVACTDVNHDGVPLTVTDFVYLVRILVGDALPMPRPNPCALASFSIQGSTVKVATNVDLGAVFLIFDGRITPELAEDVGHMDMGYYQTGNTTRVFIYSLEQNDFISSGELLYFVGDASLDSVETAEYRGTVMNTIIGN